MQTKYSHSALLTENTYSQSEYQESFMQYCIILLHFLCSLTSIKIFEENSFRRFFEARVKFMTDWGIYQRELRDYSLCIIRMWSLFCSIRIYAYLTYSFKNLVFRSSVICFLSTYSVLKFMSLMRFPLWFV